MTFCAVRCCAETQAVPGHEIHQNPLFFGTYSQSFQQFIVRPFCIHLEYINMVQIRASVGKGREQKPYSGFPGSYSPDSGQTAQMIYSNTSSVPTAFLYRKPLRECRNDHEIPEWIFFIRPVFLHDNIIKCIHQGVFSDRTLSLP